MAHNKYKEFKEVFDRLTQGSRLAGTRPHNGVFPESANHAAEEVFNYRHPLLCTTETDPERFNQLLSEEARLLAMSQKRSRWLVVKAIGPDVSRGRSYYNLTSEEQRRTVVQVSLGEIEPIAESEIPHTFGIGDFFKRRRV